MKSQAKKSLIALAIATGLSGNAFAASSVSDISVVQSGQGQEATVSQTGLINGASVVQTGTDQVATVQQNGVWHEATINSIGTDNTVKIRLQ